MQSSSKHEATNECPLASPKSRQKRAKTGANPSPKEKPCIICDQIKYQGDTKKFHICEENAAKTLLQAANSNKDSVYTRCILFKGMGDVYAADVTYHNNCVSRDIKKFLYDVDTLMTFGVDDDRSLLEGTDFQYKDKHKDMLHQSQRFDK